MVCFLLFARPVLLRLAGFVWHTPAGLPVPAAFALTKHTGRSEYLRGRLARGADGRLVAERIAREGSGILTSMVDASGLIELDDDVREVRPGDPVPFLSFAELGVPA
jgi:molybdopterin molybdotransferase